MREGAAGAAQRAQWALTFSKPYAEYSAYTYGPCSQSPATHKKYPVRYLALKLRKPGVSGLVTEAASRPRYHSPPVTRTRP